MASFNEVGLDDVINSIEKLADLPQKTQDDMLKAGAEVLIGAQKTQATKASKTKRSTGTLADSIEKTSPKYSSDNFKRVIDVFPQGEHPHGYDRRGSRANVRSATVGFMLEYGTSKMPARPWMRRAVKKSANDVQEAMKKEWEAAVNGI